MVPLPPPPPPAPPPPPPPLPPPPPQATAVAIATSATTATNPRRSRLRRLSGNRKTPKQNTAVVSSNLRPVVDQGCRADDTADPDAVVVIVRVTGTVVVDDVKVTVEGLKLQVLYGGKFEHIEGERVPVPVKPF